MIRLVLIIILFLISLLCVFKAPEFYCWYVQILATEFSWIFILLSLVILGFSFNIIEYRLAVFILGLSAVILFSLPIVGAMRISKSLDKELSIGFKSSPGMINRIPFSLFKIFGLIREAQITPEVIKYDSAHDLTLDFYKSQKNQVAPCIVVVHGGSWSGGDSKQLPELNSHLSHEGYNVVSINYRLAPEFKSPAPVEDINTAIKYLMNHSKALSIDTDRFVLLGRSAGAQIVLAAASDLHFLPIRGVISFYGPEDMIWGYQHPASKLVMDSKKVMEDYLGGSLTDVTENYRKSSPMELVIPNYVPTLMVHGENDPLVAYEHSLRFSNKLKAAGVPYFLLSLPWATHGCDYTLNGPSGQLSTYSVDYFLTAIFKK